MLGDTNRSADIAPTKEVCRCLFGPPDHDAIKQLLREQQEDDLSHAQERWNFDFKSETPTSGRYEWEDPASGEIPSAYALTGLTATAYAKRKRDEELDRGDEHKENVPKFTRTQEELGEIARSLASLPTPSSSPAAAADDSEAEVTESRTVPNTAVTSPPRSRQPTLKEYYPSKKNISREKH